MLFTRLLLDFVKKNIYLSKNDKYILTNNGRRDYTACKKGKQQQSEEVEYESERNGKVSENDHSRNRNPVSAFCSLVFAVVSAADTAGNDGQGILYWELYFHSGDGGSVSDLSVYVLGSLRKDWTGQILFQRECTGAEADEPMDDGGYDPVCRAAGSMLFAGMVPAYGQHDFCGSFNPVSVHCTVSDLRSAFPSGI